MQRVLPSRKHKQTANPKAQNPRIDIFPATVEEEDPNAPLTFEGRALDRPGQEIQDQGLSFDLQTVVSRRRMLSMIGIGASAAALAACTNGNNTANISTSAPTADANIEEMPTETNGPYPGDGTNGPDVLDISGVERSDIRSSIGSETRIEGVEVTLTMRIIDIHNNYAPYAGAAIYIWQCNAEGQYSMYSSGVQNETFLRGVQIADDDGRVTFKTIFPGCYDGRWPHIHFEVFPDKASTSEYNNNVLVSQLAMPQDKCQQVYELSQYPSSKLNFSKFKSVQEDNIFADSFQLQTPATSGSAQAGYTMTIDVGIDTTTKQQQSVAGGAPGGFGGSGAQPPSEGVPPSSKRDALGWIVGN